MIVFLDTNVLFSAQLSEEGAAFEVLGLSQQNVFDAWTSDICLAELESIEHKARPGLRSSAELLKRFPLSILALQKREDHFSKYVVDLHDSHVVEGAFRAKADFLITFNTKDFRRDLIFQDFQIRVLTQGYFLQWLRDQGKY